MNISDLKHGDCVKCFINGNFASGRVVKSAGNSLFLANNDYASHFNIDGLRKRSERFDYRLLFALDSNATKVEKVEREKLPYKTRDILEDEDGIKYKILARSGALHFLSGPDSFDEADTCAIYTRKDLDKSAFKLCLDDSETDTSGNIEDMTLDEICEELGRTVRVRKG